MSPQVFFVGTPDEVSHHAAPLDGLVDYQVVSPECISTVASSGDLAIFFSEHFDRFRDAIHQLRKMGVATLYLIDGILEWRNAWVNRADEPACPFTMRPVLCDKVACIGPSQFRVLQNWGNFGKTEIVGIPRLDYLRGLQKRERSSDQPFRLMVATAKCPSYTETDRENLKRCLTDIRDLTNRTNNVEVVWRLTADWDQKLSVDNSLSSVKGRELVDQLQTVDAVITTPSTTALESMILDLPTAIVDYNNCPVYCQSAWMITAATQVESQIGELLVPSEAKMLYQRQVLTDALFLESKSSHRLIALIQGMLEHRIAHPTSAFPEQILDKPKSLAVEFNSASLFDQFDEFKIDNVDELQTELAHSRREINHLNSQLKQLRNELAEAHQIFDEINGHPIAGPIVKVRQKLLQLVQKLRGSSPQAEIR